MKTRFGFENTWGYQVEVLPRLTILYGEVVAFEWLWFGLWFDFGKDDELEGVEQEYDMPKYPEDAINENEQVEVNWTKYKIVVPTDEDKRIIEQAFEHIHYSDVDTDYVPVNQLIHEYHDPTKNNIIVDGEIYNKLNESN